MDKIVIKRSVNADSRTVENKSKESLLIDTLNHVSDVQKTMNLLVSIIIAQVSNHDYTKIKYFDEFYNALFNSPEVKITEWYKKHVKEERHHTNEGNHDDVNLIDILEELVDKVVAGKGRSGKIDLKYFKYNPEIMERAYHNTIKLIDNLTEIES